LRNADLHLLANAEEVIDRIPARKDNGSELGDIDLLLAEILARNRFQPNERKKGQLHVVFFGELEIRRLVGFGSGLSD
jgi:hypothetical protein